MAMFCLDQCSDDATSVRPYISWPFGLVVHPFGSHENPSISMIQEQLEKYENQRLNNSSARKSLRSHLGNPKFTPQKRTDRPEMALAERDEISKDSPKTKIRASKNMMSHLGNRVQECFVKTATKFPRLCGWRKSM